MKRIVLFDPSYGTSNMGDFIINEAVMSEMSYLFDKSFTIRYSTHSPLLGSLQQLRSNRIIRNCRDADLKFIGGTNILKDNLFKLDPGWNVDLMGARLYSGAVCIGVGRAISRAEGRPGRYTRKVYERALSKDFYHSVRDESTKVYLESLGFKAINTGCPTTWGLTPELAAEIPVKKAPNVVLTLTDYARDREADSFLLSTLIANYESVSLWIQGSGDLDYLKSFDQSSRIKLIPPSLSAFARELDRE
ncbi:MAG: polysaccharide pyruvyl transferase family protein, partial [Microbacterium sp.]